MAGTNQIVKNAFAEYKKQMMDEIEKRCKSYANALIDYAIQFRETNPNAHNITGNLLDSIIVVVYKKGKPIFAEYADDYIRTPIAVKMTKPNVYHFEPDYDGSGSSFKASVETNEGMGWQDAEKFFATYKPKGKNMFDIVVAYTTEYANFVEQTRQSTGIMELYAHTDHFGVNFLQLPRVA